MKTMAKVLLCIALLLSSLMMIVGTGSSGEQGQSRYFEQGYAERTENDLYWVLSLSGSWKDMGRQYGGLVGDELQAFHAEMTADLISRGVDQNARLAMGQQLYNGYSQELQELLLGISQTSGLAMNETLILNAGMVLLTIAVLGDEPPAACSGIAVWDDYSADGSLLFGRNWDIDREAMSRYLRYLAVVLFHPPEGHAFANIHPLGNVYLETGMNSRGLFIELNNGEYSDPAVYEDRQDTSSVLASVLNQCEDVQQAAAMLKGIPADISYILQIADPNHAVSLERPTFDARVRNLDDHGLVIAFNSFVPPYPASWVGMVSPPRPAEMDPRYENMLSLSQSPSYKRLFTPEKMKAFLEVPMEDGGAYHAGTVLQVVALPAELTIWIRGCDYSDWERIPLALYFME